MTDIAAIELANVMAYRGRHRLELPRAGVVLLSGRNGEGKSSFVEALPAAGWNETLRGTPIWRSGEGGSVEVQLHDGLTMRRTCSKAGAKRLDWWRGDQAAEGRKEWESSQKAQAELLAELGPFEVWRRCAVFSSQDVDTFAASAHGARMALLERLFGLDRFGPALKRAREERAAKDRLRSGTDGELRQLRAALESNRASLVDARALLETKDEPPPSEPARAPANTARLEEAVLAIDFAAMERRAAQLREQVEAYRDRISAAEGKRDQADRDRDLAREAASRARFEAQAVGEAAKVLEGGVCPTCGTSRCPKCGHDLIGVRMVDLQASAAKSRAAADEAALRAADRSAAASTAKTAAETELTELREERGDLRTKAQGLEEKAKAERRRADDAARAKREAERLRREREEAEARARAERERAQREREAARKRAGEVVAKMEVAIAEAERAVLEAERKASEQAALVQVLEAVDRVLGPAGVRVQVLARGLAGLAEVTNGIFALAGWNDLRIALKSFRLLADGKTQKDEIDLLVEGAGGGHGYRATSGGEHRRIDVALVLGAAEIGAAAHGRAGTLWFDEVFDGLDAGGLDGIVRVLEAMSKRRAIVVITHRADLADRLRPAVHYHVENHEIRRVA